VLPALSHDDVTLIRNAFVRRLETDESGRTVTSVVADVDGHGQRFAADLVVLSAGAVNSAKILLASANDRHPGGLANGSDQVGRNYVFHNSRAFLAVSTEKNDTRFQKTLGLNDYYFGDSDFDYPMGNVQMVGKSSAPMYRGEKPVETALAPMFALRDVAEHAVDFWLSTEDLPDPDNRVTLDPGGNVVLSYTPNNQEPMEQLYHRVKKHLNRLGMHPHHLIPRSLYMKNDVPVAGCAHQAGTVRFGHDPATSVLDTDCKAHEVDNLYVVDTSFFPSIGAVNPALTAIANALRVGDHLLERLG
jgi:choline dehydrogenase-like flavoprotein